MLDALLRSGYKELATECRRFVKTHKGTRDLLLAHLLDTLERVVSYLKCVTYFL